MSIFATRRKRLQHLGTEQRKSWVELQEYIGTKWGEYRIYTSQTYIVIGFLFYYFYYEDVDVLHILWVILGYFQNISEMVDSELLHPSIH